MTAKFSFLGLAAVLTAMGSFLGGAVPAAKYAEPCACCPGPCCDDPTLCPNGCCPGPCCFTGFKATATVTLNAVSCCLVEVTCPVADCCADGVCCPDEACCGLTATK